MRASAARQVVLRLGAAAALLSALAVAARAQVETLRPEPVPGPGIPVATGRLSTASPSDTVPTFLPFLSSINLIPRYLADVGPEPQPEPESYALDTYLVEERDRQSRAAWEQARLAVLAGETPVEGDTIPRLGGALRLPKEIAQVIGPASLDVNGRLRVSLGGGKTTLNPDLRPPGFPGNNFNLDLDQIFELGVRGTVGRKVNLAVDYNSEREFQNKNVLSAFYVGDEDEILKRVDLGDISVSLPPSRFINAGATKGNFGFQSVAQLGPVSMRGIASKKEGQSTQRSLTITPRTQGVLETSTVELKDTQYQNNRFFLMFRPESLSAAVPDHPRIAFPNQGTRLSNPTSTPRGETLNVWLDNGNVTDDLATNAKFGTAYVNPRDKAAFADEAQTGFFNLLVEGQDFYLVDNLILVTSRELNANEKLAVSYVTAGGDSVGTPQDADTLELKLVKPVNPDSLDFTWEYTMRNVYPLRGTEVLLQSLTIYRGDQQLRVDIENVDGVNVKLSQLLGVADSSERPLNQQVGRDPFGGPDFLVFPDLQPFFEAAPPDPPRVVSLDVPNRALYETPPEQRLSATQDQVYSVQATYLGKAAATNEVELGALNILEGSETVSIGGVKLERGTDYQIFYDFGRLVFTEPDALFSRFPNAQVEIDFEVAPLFNLAPTSVAGFNAVYQPGENLFLNSSVLMQSTESLSNRPILGAEPTRSILGEVDGNYKLELPGLTEALDGLPLLRARGLSTLQVRGEMALNLPNPNTEGRVFLNDFEGVEIADAISLNNRTFLFGSAPQGRGLVAQNARDLQFSTRAIPINQVTTQEQQVGNRAVVEVMRVDLRDAIVPGVRPEDSWRSITHRVSIQGADFSRREAVEFFVAGTQGKILVDLGTVSEDGVRFSRASQALGEPVGAGDLNTEDVNRDNQLDAAEDTGLDAVPGNDASGVPGDDGNDDFEEATNPDGTEGNDVLDSEDLNLNGVLDQREDLLRWVVDLTSDKYVVPGAGNDENGFRKIRLPLARPDAVAGNPDVRRVQALRLTFVEFGPSPGPLDLAQLQVVGSTFLERGIVDSLGVTIAGDRSDSLSISQVNTLENFGTYTSPPGVRAQQERADEIIRTGLQPLKEQSLVLAYSKLPPGAQGRIYQALNDRENYLDYRRMRIFTNGQAQFTAGGPIFDRQPTFFVEFGSDTLNVYRFQAPLRLNAWEEHDIDFSVLTDLKSELLERLAAAGADTGSIASPDGRYQVVIRDGRTPPPTLSQISQLTIGVLNDVGVEIQDGSFWVDDWRLTDPLTEGGGARYVAASAQLADVGTLDVQYEGKDARFRNLDAAINNQTSRDIDVRSSFRLDRLLPAGLGVEMPATVDYFTTNDSPLFLLGSDVELAENATLRERQDIDNHQTVATVSLQRSQRSRNWLLRSTVDRLSARFTTRSQAFSSLDTDRDDSAWDLTLRYDTDFAPKPIPLPFRFLAGLPLPGFVKESKGFRSFVNMDLNLVPSRLSLTGTRVSGEDVLTKRQGFFNAFSESALDSVITSDSTQTVTGDLNVTVQPTSSLRASYVLSTTRDLNFPDPQGRELDRSFLPGVEALRTQRFDLQWTPPVTDWLIPRYNYNASYGLTHTREVSQVLLGQNLFDFTNQVAKGWTVELNVPVLLDRARGAEPRPGAPGAPPERGHGFDLAAVLQPVRFETSKRLSSGFRQVPGDPALGYAFGLQDPRDVDADAQSISELDRLALKSGLAPLPNLQIQGGYEHNQNERIFFGGTNAEDQVIWPDANLRWSLASVPGLSGVLNRLDLTSAYRGESGSTAAKGLKLSRYDRFSWAPLVGFDATWFGGLVTNFRVQRSDGETTQIRNDHDDSIRTESATDLELTLNYLFRPGTKVFLPIPFLIGERIKGPLRTSLTLARRLREDVTEQAGQEAAPAAGQPGSGVNTKTTTIEIRPALAYDLTRLSSGISFSYLLRQDEKRDVDTTTYNVEVFVDLIF